MRFVAADAGFLPSAPLIFFADILDEVCFHRIPWVLGELLIPRTEFLTSFELQTVYIPTQAL
jgi:hypothetical protein